MDLADIIEVAKAYNKLGSAVQDQLDVLLSNPTEAEGLNINAVDMIRRDFLRELERLDDDAGDELRMALDEWYGEGEAA